MKWLKYLSVIAFLNLTFLNACSEHKHLDQKSLAQDLKGKCAVLNTPNSANWDKVSQREELKASLLQKYSQIDLQELQIAIRNNCPE